MADHLWGPRPRPLASDDLDALPLGTAEEERIRAKAWMDTAALHARDVAALHARDEEYCRREVTREDAKLWSADFRACMAAVIDSEGGSPEHFVAKAKRLADAMAVVRAERRGNVP